MIKAFKFIKSAYSGLPGAVWALAVVNLINRMGTMVLPFLSLYVHEDLGYSNAMVGLAVGCYGLGALLGSWWGGWISDRVNPYYVLIAHLLGSGVCLLALEHMRHQMLLIPGLVLLGTVSEAVRPTTFVLLVGCCDLTVRPRSFSLLRMAINLGSSFGPLLGGYLAVKSYGWLFRIDGVNCLAAVLPLLMMKHAKAMGHMSRRDKSLPRSAGSVWTDRPFMVFMLLVLLTGTMFMQLWSTYPLFLKLGQGLDEQHYGMVMSVNGLMIITCEMALTHGLSHLRPLRVAAAGLVFLALGLGVQPWGHGFIFVLATALLWTAAEMLILPFISTFVSKSAPSDKVGSYMGMYNMGWAAAFIIAPVLGTFAIEQVGFIGLWTSVACLGVLATTLCWRLDAFHLRQETAALEPAPKPEASLGGEHGV